VFCEKFDNPRKKTICPRLASRRYQLLSELHKDRDRQARVLGLGQQGAGELLQPVREPLPNHLGLIGLRFRRTKPSVGRKSNKDPRKCQYRKRLRVFTTRKCEVQKLGNVVVVLGGFRGFELEFQNSIVDGIVPAPLLLFGGRLHDRYSEWERLDDFEVGRTEKALD